MKRFLSGDEAFAEGVRLARPAVISAYPITPQTVVVERLSEMVESGQLEAQYVHVESEHSALSCAMGASATGVRTFTATSSQGLLYMAEVLTYAAGGRFPIVMMNANRATALPWNIYGDQRDSLALLDHGWVQVYAQDNQEALDLALMAYAVAEDARVSLPVMVNIDGFALTHTYESVDIPTQQQADEFLPPYSTANRFDFEHPVNLGYSAGPEFNRYYQYEHHRDMMAVGEVVTEVEEHFATVMGRQYSGMIEEYRSRDAEYVMVCVGSIAGLARQVVDKLRAEGMACGMVRLRYLRPFPATLLARAVAVASAVGVIAGLARQVVDKLRAEGMACGMVRLRYLRPFPATLLARAVAVASAVGVLEKDVSFGAEGTVFTNVNSALKQAGEGAVTANFIGGLGGDDITATQIEQAFRKLAVLANQAEGSGGAPDAPAVYFLGIDPLDGEVR